MVILQEANGEKAEELVKKCPVNVFDIEDIGKGKAVMFSELFNSYVLDEIKEARGSRSSIPS